MSPQDEPMQKNASVDSPRRSARGAISSSENSWNRHDDLNSNHSIEMLAIKAQLKNSLTENQSLKRRNYDLESLVTEKEFLLQDVISKFKKERSYLKSRIMKLETRLNASAYDESLDIKPAKGSKSVQ